MNIGNHKSGLVAVSRSLTTSLSLFLVILFAVIVCPTSDNLGQTESSVAAKFLRVLDPPGSGDQFQQPGQIFIDKKFSEVFVSDVGNNRVVVFDTTGVFKFAFSGHEEFGSPTGIVVNSHGFIFVLGSRRGEVRSLFQFDYDGTYLGPLAITEFAEDSIPDIRSIAVDDNDNLYLLTELGNRVIKVDAQGRYLGQFPVLEDLKSKERAEAVLGAPRIDGDRLYLPASMFGTVYVYSLDGEFIRHIGIQGNNVGELNFPCAVDVINHEIVVVLDKHRFNTLCYSLEGEYLGEFGGMGYSLGWFYHPEFLAVDNLGRSYIGQGLGNRVQVCELPEFIAAKIQATSHSSILKDGQASFTHETTKEEVRLETQTLE